MTSTCPLQKRTNANQNQVFPPVKFVLDKFKHKLPKDELKRLGKEIAKKLVSSDYKNNRVEDPTAKLSDKQNKKIKTYVKDFLDRAVHKFGTQQKPKPGDEKEDEAEQIDLGDSDAEDDAGESRKRKRDTEGPETATATPSDGPDVKRIKEDDGPEPSPPPPPPPPPDAGRLEESEAMRQQEDELMRENEEAQRIEDAAKAVDGDQNRKQEVLSH